ncbi:AraC family transcriptional regulator [Ruficoccus sp. ZRK36]|uniref:AraC family transcriptional regulator n=1 Tax=Ruficoccus sp. ZRK36 TaxID=2866311 RepID=UPI001C737E6C|nr:AraC family transcriptional regulator [Ruficoccus sp. ZRK36]QYY34495.1 AraC family transcriptional regulator [Ruficoccus sp. ZRK36]
MLIDPKFEKSLSGSESMALIALFDDISETLFWIKDRKLRIMALNATFAERVNAPESEIIGKTDADLYYPELARVFMADDRQVIKTGKPLRRKAELLATRFGEIEWRSTTKLPIFDAREKVIGTTGISRPLSTEVDNLPSHYQACSDIVRFARERLSEGVDVVAIAAHAGMSLSTLSRWFRKHLRLSPGEFLSQLRTARASKLLLDSPLNMTEIALECGYESPAAFSRAFRRQMGLSPSDFRRGQRWAQTLGV